MKHLTHPQVSAPLFVLVGFLFVSGSAAFCSVGCNFKYSNSPSFGMKTPANSDANGTSNQILLVESDRHRSRPSTFGITPTDFRKRFTETARSMAIDDSVTMKSPTVKPGAVDDAFMVMLNDNIGLVGTVDKTTGYMKGLMMTARVDGTLKSATNIIIVISALVKTINPQMTHQDTGKIAVGLVDRALKAKGKAAKDTSTAFTCTATFTDIIGLIFTVEP